MVAAGVLVSLIGLAPSAERGAARAETMPDGSAPRLDLAWYDPEALVPVGFESISREVESIFRDHGPRVVLARGNGFEAPGARPLRVIVVRRGAAAWNLGDDVMGVAPGSSVPRRNIYVIAPVVRQVLGHTPGNAREEDSAESAEMSLALGRVIAHEVVHAVAPDHPHAEDGLMHGRQRRKSLLKKRFRLDPGCVKAFLTALKRM